MGNADLTRYELSLGDPRNTTTGWRPREYASTTIEGVILAKGQSFGALGAGGYAVYENSGFVPMVIAEGDLLKDSDGKYYVVKTCPEQWILNKFIGYFPCDLQRLINYPETAASVPTADQEDTRYRTKVWIEDRVSSTADWACIYAFPDYPLQLEFTGANAVDFLYCVGTANSKALYQFDELFVYGYLEQVPVTIAVLQKYSQDNTAKMLWAAEDALRTACRDYPLGSKRTLEFVKETTQRLGSYTVVMRELTLKYKRSSDYFPNYPKITWGPSASPTGIYIFPNVVELTPWGANKDAWNDIPAMSGDSVQPMGSKAFEFRLVCDLDVEPYTAVGDRSWKRPQTTTPKTDATKYDLAWDLCHNEGIAQAYHTFTLQSGGPALSVRLCDDWFVDNENMLHLHFREYRTTSADALTYKERLGIT